MTRDTQATMPDGYIPQRTDGLDELRREMRRGEAALDAHMAIGVFARAMQDLSQPSLLVHWDYIGRALS